MTDNGANSPFILRFSKSMYKDNPRQPRGGKPRKAEGVSIDPYQVSENLSRGYRFYSDFEYNKGLPVHSILSLKQGSLSKSLRYHFLKTAGLKLLGSISPDTFVFSIKSRDELSKICGILKYSRNSAFRASLSHFDRIDWLSPDDKIKISPYTESIKNSDVFYLQIFPDAENLRYVQSFLKNDMNAHTAEKVRIGGGVFIKTHMPGFKEKLEKMFTHSMIRSVVSGSEVILYEQYIRHTGLPLECILKRDFDRNYPKAAVVDSGLSENSFLKEWEISTESFIDPKQKNPAHGTFVTGRLLGHGENFGGITFLNVEMMPGNGELPLEKMYTNLRKLLTKYHKTIKIYNISMGTGTAAGESFSLAAYMLDTLQMEFDVLFIISAGNTDPSDVQNDIRISVPAESVHSVTVGSVSHTDTNLQKKMSPSLFSRQGPGCSFFIKPDVASFGGANEKRYGRIKPVGVFSIGVKNELAEDCGTSHAAPLITAMAARIYHRYSHAFKSPDVTKAMIIHSAFLNKTQKKPDIHTGFGVLSPDEENTESATYVHEGFAVLGKIVEIPEIPVPEDVFENGKAACSVTATLVYKTATDINFPHYYCACNVEISLGYYKKDRWVSVLTAKDIAGMPEKGVSGRKDIAELFRWQPVKVYHVSISKKQLPEILCLRIIPSARDFFDGGDKIKYSLIISFSHNSKNLHKCLNETYMKYGNLLEPASDLWKTC